MVTRQELKQNISKLTPTSYYSKTSYRFSHRIHE